MLSLLIAVLCPQLASKPGELIINDQVRARVVAVGDFIDRKRKAWDAGGNPMNAEAARKLKDFLSEHNDQWMNKDSLENPGDIGRFLLIEATYPKGWIISEAYMRGAWVGTIMGDLKDDGDEWMRFVSLQPGAKTYDLPLFVSSGKSTALYEFPAEGKSTIGDASIDVQCSQGATTLDTQTTHKEYPLAVYKISAEMPKEKITNALDVEPVNVPELRPTGDKDFDSHIGMEKFMHGVEDVKDLHNGRIRITFFMHVPGLRNPSTRLRIVRKDIQRPTITVAIVPAK